VSVTDANDPERRWLAEVYRPGVPQLTVRAVVTGMVLGAVMCLSNLYVVLKTGWSFGVTITACILAYALFAGLRSIGAVRREFGPLENNAMGSVASAAGYMTGVIGALITEILRRRNPALADRTVTPVASGFIAGESLMGITIAILVVLGVLTR